jgi:hypothetical protein
MQKSVIDKELIEGIARAKFLMRLFSTQKLKTAGVLLNNLDYYWPSSDYKNWSSLNIEEKQKWVDLSYSWLLDLKTHRPYQYQILSSGWKNIDNA